ncbi:MAG TPA: DNA polymerase III subunit delta [Chthoniobacterales bacterium]|nr:DNA polymerase III subunit delta [Chthoniobacterales bacterium]
MPKAKARTVAPAKIYAVVGSDDLEVKHTAAELAEKLKPAAAGEFGLETIDGSADNADQAASRIRSTIEALRTLPFFGGEKLVWLKNANFLGDDVKARSASVQAALEELSETIDAGLGSEITFLLSAIDVDKRRSFYKSVAKRAELQIFDKLDSSRGGWEEEATEMVQNRAKKRKLQFDDDALELFVLLTGGDTREIENELEKIDIHLGKERAVKIDLVRELVPLTREGVIFDLSNALAERDLERALDLVRQLLDQGESAIGILLVAVLPTVRNLLLAKDLMERYRIPRPHVPFPFISAINRLPADATAHLPRKKDGSINAYTLGIAAQNAHRFSTNQLIAGMKACLAANLQLVTTQLDHELVLTEVVVKLLGES